MFTNPIRCENSAEMQEVLQIKYLSLEKENNRCASPYIVLTVFAETQEPITHSYKSGSEQFLEPCIYRIEF